MLFGSKVRFCQGPSPVCLEFFCLLLLSLLKQAYTVSDFGEMEFTISATVEFKKLLLLQFKPNLSHINSSEY